MILAFYLLVFGALAACLGCTVEAPLRASDVLRLQFPEQAAHVLQQDEAFVATDQGFAIVAPLASDRARPLLAEMPQQGSSAIRFQLASGFEVRVREMDAGGEGALIERAVTYPRAGGVSFWTAVPGGVEEWLYLEAGAARRGQPLATWEVEGATVRQRGDAVELIDAGGVVQLTVTAPRAYTTGGQEVRARLTGGNAQVVLWVDAEEQALLVDPLWSPAGLMINARREHTATRLPSGKVLMVGGLGYGASQGTAELYDPEANSFLVAGSLATGRAYHGATLLMNGQVLVVAGAGGQTAPETAELYDPLTNGFLPGGMLLQARNFPSVTLLPNGKALVVGGYQSGDLDSTELYDPAAGSFLPAGKLATARRFHTATLLQDGRVLVAGGMFFGGELASAELYDPASNTFSPAGALGAARSVHTATLLQDGRVLVVGGVANGSGLASAELYDPASNTFSPAGALATARYEHTATLLPSGKVLVVGGSGSSGSELASAEMYDPQSNSFQPASALATARFGHTATLVSDGRVLVAGGGDNKGGYLGSAELYNSLLPLGSPCTLATDCPSGFCADGVCCDAACSAGPCDACSKAAGATSDGTCELLTGPGCNDGDLCTKGDTCKAGICTSGAPIFCTALDICHAVGSCSPQTGLCSNPEKPSCVLPDVDPPPQVPPEVVICKSDTECSTGHCVQGICCDSACTEPCHSCALPGSFGECTPEPKGVDLRNDCGAEANCLSTCSGEADGHCIGAGQGTQCLPSQCQDDEVHGEGPAFCPSAGAVCPTGERVPFSCAPYRCVKALGACRSICSSISDCAPPYVCDPSHHCIPAPDVASGEESGCALSPGTTRERSSRWLLLLFPALAVARRLHGGGRVPYQGRRCRISPGRRPILSDECAFHGIRGGIARGCIRERRGASSCLSCRGQHERGLRGARDSS